MVVGVVALLAALTSCSDELPPTPTEPTWKSTAAGPATPAAPAAPTAASPASVAVEPRTRTRTRTAAAKTSVKKAPARTPKLTCEPDAPARLVGNTIVNKNCPALIASKKRAQREYAEEQLRQESEAALQSCREQTGMSTEECVRDAKAGNAN